jgi:hypothetical protein
MFMYVYPAIMQLVLHFKAAYVMDFVVSFIVSPSLMT